jgi:PAS domain S-box-containing protein
MSKSDINMTDRMHILVIDDDAQILLLMQQILGSDFNVHVFDCGESAIQLVRDLLQQNKPIIAGFIDLMLPGVSGLEISKVLHQIDDRINVILMTGDPNFSSAEIDTDLVDHLLLIQKPFAIEEVLLQARFFQRSWLRDQDLQKQKKALKNENEEKEAIAARNQAVLETALDCIITIDSQGRIVEWNPAAERTFGYTREEIMGSRLSDTIVPHALRSAHEAGMSHYNKTHEGPILGQRIEVPAIHKTGREFPVELTVNPIILGKTRLFTAYLRDISSQRDAAAQLMLQAKALEAAANGIVITDPRGIIVWCNGAFCELTGYEETEILGNPISVLKSNVHDKTFYRDMWETILSGQVWVGEIRNRRKSGEIYTEEMTITPVNDDEGHPTHFIAIKQDVTALRQIDEKLDRSEQNQRIINYFATSLLGSNTVDEILWDIAHNCISELGLEDAVVYLVSEDGSSLVQKAAYGSKDATDNVIKNPLVIPMGKGIVGVAAETGAPVIVQDVSKDDRYILDDMQRASELAVPILYENKVIGVIDSEHSQVNFFQEHHLQILEAIASLAANKHMRSLSMQQTEKSEKKYRSIFESIQDIYAEVDYDSGLILEISPSIERGGGYQREEMIGKPMGDYFDPPEVPAALMELLLSKGEVNDYNVNLVNKAGEPRSVSFSVTLLRDANGKPEKVVGTMRDITERKKAVKQIEESEERLKTILNVLPTGILIVTPENGIIEEANPAAAEIMDLSLGNILGQEVFEVLSLDNTDMLTNTESLFQEPQDVNLLRKKGDSIPLLISKIPVQIGEKKYHLLSFVDNSLQKMAEAALKTNIEMKTNFVSILSHELRTPMTSIYGFAGTILRDENMPEAVRMDFTRIIFEESQRLTRLIENVLDLSRMEAGRMNYNMSPLQFDVIIAEALETHQVLLRDKHIQVVQNITTDPPLIEADHDSMNQMIINLISNAIKFSDPGSQITLGLSLQDGRLEFRVKDSGLGIPEKDLPHIFDKFYRVQRKGREDQGTGIGLSIVKEIIDRHGGSLHVESTVGVGTEFRVCFPLISAEADMASTKGKTNNDK